MIGPSWISFSDLPCTDSIRPVSSRERKPRHQSSVAGEHQHRLREEPGVVPCECEQEQDQQLAQLRTELADHAEVEQVDPLVPPHQVPRVRVGVEEAVGQDLPVVRLEQLARRLLARHSCRCLADGDALNLLLDEQAGGGELVVDARDPEARKRRKHLAHPVDVLRLLPKVELAAQ